MNNTLDDFFGDGSDGEVIPECSFCGETEGELIVSIQDACGPTHWHHKACKEADDAKKGTPITPTWDETMDTRLCMKEDSKGNWEPSLADKDKKMKHTTYRQIKFNEVSPNEPFYLIHPNTVRLPAVPVVHYPCQNFQANINVWVVDSK